MALGNLKPSPMLVVDREVENEKVASTRCAAWDLLCQADWVITIQVRNLRSDEEAEIAISQYAGPSPSSPPHLSQLGRGV